MNDMRRPAAARPNAANPDAPDAASADSMARMSAMLMEQALALDAMFGELVEYSAKNFKAWPGITERYMHLALRAQTNCRTSLQAMVKADQARERLRARDGDGDTPAAR